MWRCLVLVLLARGVARADVPLGVTATLGAGLTRSAGDTDFSGGSVDRALSAKLDLGVRVHERLMIGIHGSLATVATVHRFFYEDDFGTPETIDELHILRPLQLGISGQYALDDRVYLAGWIGIHGGWHKHVCTTDTVEDMPSSTGCNESKFEPFGEVAPAFGLAVGYDLLAHQRHRLTVAVAGSYALPADDEYFRWSYATVSIDLGYRFWTR